MFRLMATRMHMLRFNDMAWVMMISSGREERREMVWERFEICERKSSLRRSDRVRWEFRVFDPCIEERSWAALGRGSEFGISCSHTSVSSKVMQAEHGMMV